METRQINNTSTEALSRRQMYETKIGEDSIEIIAYKFHDGSTNVVQPRDGNKAPEDITLDAFLTRSLNEMAEGLMTIKPEFTVKEDVQVLEDRVTVKISK